MDHKITLSTGLEGYYKLEAIRPDGSVRLLKDWFKNRILDQGLDHIAVERSAQYAYAGTSGAAVADNQVGMQALLWTSTTVGAGDFVYGAASSAPYYVWGRRVFLFAANSGSSQNIAEVGVGWSNVNNTSAYSRALVSPTVSVLNGEQLQVTYENRVYQNTTDVTGQITLNNVLYDYTLRPVYVNSISSWGTSVYLPHVPMHVSNNCGSCGVAYTGSSAGIGDVTGHPTGTAHNRTSYSMDAYVTGSYKRRLTNTWGPSVANDATYGIKAVKVATNYNSFTMSEWQIGFAMNSDPTKGIMKTSSDTLSLIIDVSWARRP